MGHKFFRQERFAKYRFKAKPEDQREASAAYLESKEVENFAKAKKPSKTRNVWQDIVKEMFCQCWKCHSVMTFQAFSSDGLRCICCGGNVELLTIDGRPV